MQLGNQIAVRVLEEGEASGQSPMDVVALIIVPSWCALTQRVRVRQKSRPESLPRVRPLSGSHSILQSSLGPVRTHSSPVWAIGAVAATELPPRSRTRLYLTEERRCSYCPVSSQSLTEHSIQSMKRCRGAIPDHAVYQTCDVQPQTVPRLAHMSLIHKSTSRHNAPELLTTYCLPDTC